MLSLVQLTLHSKTGLEVSAGMHRPACEHVEDFLPESAQEVLTLLCRLAGKRASLLDAQKAEPKKEDTRVFKPASPCKKSTAPHAGDIYGTISPILPHISVRGLHFHRYTTASYCTMEDCQELDSLLQWEEREERLLRACTLCLPLKGSFLKSDTRL